MNPRTSVPEVRVQWAAREVRSMAATAYRDLADEARVAGDLVAAREFERLAETPEATLDAAREAWEARFGEASRETVASGLEVER